MQLQIADRERERFRGRVSAGDEDVCARPERAGMRQAIERGERPGILIQPGRQGQQALPRARGVRDPVRDRRPAIGLIHHHDRLVDVETIRIDHAVEAHQRCALEAEAQREAVQ